MTNLFLDDPLVSSVVFYPRKSSIPSNLPENVKPLNFKVNEDITIGGFCYIKDKALPTILFFHGNGEIAQDYFYFYEIFFDCNVNLAVADFRGYGHSTGQPIYSGLITDAMPIYDQFVKWMDENNMKNSLFVEGRSLGSVCAAEIGSHNPKDLRGIIFESGFASIYNMMIHLFGVRGPEITPERLSEFSNDTRIKKFQKPTLVIHGTMDFIVPTDEGKTIFDTIPKGVEKKLVLIEGATHNDILSFKEQYFKPLKEFIQKFK